MELQLVLFAARPPPRHPCPAPHVFTLAHPHTPRARPVVALVDGPCFGGGVGVVSACDMAFATERSAFALSEVLLMCP